MAQENGIDLYGGSAREAGWYEKQGRVVAIFAGERLLWKANDYDEAVFRPTPLGADAATAGTAEQLALDAAQLKHDG